MKNLFTVSVVAFSSLFIFQNVQSQNYSLKSSKLAYDKVIDNVEGNITNDFILVENDKKLASTDKPSNYTYIQLENIYFKSGDDIIDSNSTENLNTLYNLMIQNPSMEVELRAHTDMVETKNNDMALSNKRAESTRNYLISKGIKPSRLSATGLGKSDPLVPCGDDCNEYQNEINRRVEIIIVR